MAPSHTLYIVRGSMDPGVTSDPSVTRVTKEPLTYVTNLNAKLSLATQLVHSMVFVCTEIT